MIKNICKFLSKVVVAITFALFSATAMSATNLPGGTVSDVGDFGNWATEHGRELFIDNLIGEKGDLVEFQSGFQRQIVDNYVPVEARVGVAMIGGLNYVAKVLDTSLVRFVIVFIIMMYIFWIMLEAYNMMSTDNNVRKLIETLVKKTLILIFWIGILEIGPAKLFMAVVGPIISIGTYLADFILNAITQTAGIKIPDTCGAIHAYTATTIPNGMIMDATATADMLCVPTRLSGFFVTAIAAGWQWMIKGIGTSIFTFLTGVTFVVIFTWNTWKFALMALSVIMNLFLSIMLLPFTALAETIPQTTYKGIVGNIFNSFLTMFNVDEIKLDKVINKFINSAIYFVSLSIVIAVCAALLSGVVDTNMVTSIPTLEDDSFIPILLTGSLVAWLANKAGSIAGDIGGSIPDNGTGKQFTEDIKTFIKDTYGNAKSWIKAYKADNE